MAVLLFAMTTAVMGYYQKDPDPIEDPSGTSEVEAPTSPPSTSRRSLPTPKATPRRRGVAVYPRHGDMGDVGTQLHSGEIGRIFGVDALMITAGSCTGLPAQESWRLTEEVFPKVIIPMHYRDGNRGARRLEHIDAFTDYFEAPEMIHYYQTNSIIIDHDSEPQVAVLKYMG